jgi:hypothetical protein
LRFKLKLENVGKIHKAELDISPLTIFIGPAGTGKTWAAYIAYAFLKSFSLSYNSRINVKPPVCEPIDTYCSSLTESLIQARADVLNLTGENLIRTALHLNGKHISIPLESEFSFKFEPDQIATALGLRPEETKNSIAEFIVSRDTIIAALKSKKLSIDLSRGDIVEVEATAPNFSGHSVSLINDKTNLSEAIQPAIRWLVTSFFSDCTAFPSERKGLDLALSMTGLGHFSNKEKNVPLAISDYLGTRRLLRYIGSDEPSVTMESKLFSERILKGKLSVDAETKEERFFDVSGAVVDLRSSASLVKSLASIGYYLKLRPPISPLISVLVIDEPEMNAHPEVQLMLAEFFAMLANRNRHVLMTTHSPYLVDHFNNLLLAGRSSDEFKEKAKKFLKLGTGDSFLEEKSVSAYLFSDSGVPVSIFENGEIDVQTFGTETDVLANFYANISQAGELQ